ncbi:hypothetical protein [Pontibacter roseus]|uniref:hypothetical protein n=1 Tax=Pontibacter roseus TaxID=336989 RepID=UPI000367701F|nr:hypothetical protein [Pontibacter roseus]
MENFRIGIYLIVVAVLQFITILLYGYIKEGGDINAASMYPVVYLIPAVVYNFFSGLLIFMVEPKKLQGQFILLLLPALMAIVVNESTDTLGKGLYYVIIAASLLINVGFYYIVEQNRRTTSTNKT